MTNTQENINAASEVLATDIILEELIEEIMVEEAPEELPTTSTHQTYIEATPEDAMPLSQALNDIESSSFKSLSSLQQSTDESEIESTPSPQNFEPLYIEEVIGEVDAPMAELLEIINGTDSDDVIVANALDNVIFSGQGNDDIYGEGGADTFYIELTELGLVDTIKDFNVGEGDKLDLSEILFLFTPPQEFIEDYLNLVEVNGDTNVEIDMAGFQGFTTQVVLEGVTGLDPVADLIADGSIII